MMQDYKLPSQMEEEEEEEEEQRVQFVEIEI